MATYKYNCENCGDFIVEMPISKYKRLEECPTCKGKVERIIGVPSAMIFKGEGFYVNDYKKASNSETKNSGSEPGKKEKTKEKSSSSCQSCPHNNSN